MRNLADTTTVPGSAVDLRDRDEVHRIIRAAGQHLPRFLFRKWTADSGGDCALNTAEQITPHAFRHGDGPENMWQVDTTELVRTAKAHLAGGKKVDSYVSSWSASLAFVLSMGGSRPGQPTYVAVIDTAQLPPRNGVYWCGAQCFQQLIGSSRYHEEYHVFGPVRGPGFYTLAVEKLQQLLPVLSPTGAASIVVTLEPTSQRSVKPQALSIDKLGGSPLGVALVAHALSTKTDFSNDNRVLDELLDKLDVDENSIDDWTTCGTGMNLPSAAGMGLTETIRANALLRALLKRKGERFRLKATCQRRTRRSLMMEE